MEKSIILAICAPLVLQHQLALGLGINLGRGLQDPLWNDFRDNRKTPPEVVCDETDYRIIDRCAINLRDITLGGFPWYPQLKERQGNYDTLKDPMDPINRVCEVYDQTLNCLEQHSIPHVCWISFGDVLQLYTDFKFICEQPRTTALLRVLGCLQENKALDLLVYRLADRYGAHFMDQYVNGNKNAFFRFLNN